ncbi:MAG: hypothetical protein JWQ35_829 [Bacteriovoracaceae bacterium]|nr:hypothetical protein [Bacteriovoracaceae bacterium]
MRKSKASKSVILTLSIILFSHCSENSEPPEVKTLNELAVPTQPEGTLTETDAKNILRDEVYSYLLDEIKNIHREFLPMPHSSTKEKRIQFFVKTPGVPSDPASIAYEDPSFSPSNWESPRGKCTFTGEEKFEDNDNDWLPKKSSGEYNCTTHFENRSNEFSYNFSVGDEDDTNDQSGYTKEINFFQKLGGKWDSLDDAVERRMTFVYPSKSGWSLKNREKVVVIKNKDEFLIHVEKQRSTQNGDGKAAGFSYSIDEKIKPEAFEVSADFSTPELKFKMLDRVGVVESISGIVKFEFGGKSYALKISSTPLVYADHKADGLKDGGDGKTCEYSTFDSGILTLEDKDGNKLEFQHSRDPYYYVTAPDGTKSPRYACILKTSFNGKEIKELERTE